MVNREWSMVNGQNAKNKSKGAKSNGVSLKVIAPKFSPFTIDH